jgi:hypothetical protein
LINRRSVLLFLGCLGFGVFSRNHELSAVSASELSTSSEVRDELPPHFEALSFIWNTQKDKIKALELQHAEEEQKKRKENVDADSRWWFDTDERRWAVSRPFSPGRIDSTHMFNVTYILNSKELISWRVDTRKKSIMVIK